MNFYWMNNLKMPVSFDGIGFTWTGLWGFRIGNFFIGVVRGANEERKQSDE